MRIARRPNAIAVKKASGNPSQMMDVISSKPKDFTVLAGDDAIALRLRCSDGSGSNFGGLQHSSALHAPGDRPVHGGNIAGAGRRTRKSGD